MIFNGQTAPTSDPDRPRDTAVELAERIAAALPPADPAQLQELLDGVAEVSGALALVEMLTSELTKARQAQVDLSIALESNREIGAATGILMAHRHVSAQEAFDLLRVASQTRHIKLRELAKEVVETGSLTTPPSIPKNRPGRPSPTGLSRATGNGGPPSQ